MNISDLNGEMLDYWTALADGMLPNSHIVHGDVWERNGSFAMRSTDWRPSTDWAQGGPLIEKYKVGSGLEHNGKWYSEIDGYPSDSSCAEGDTPLQAICRAVVRYKFGEEIPDTTLALPKN
jgi:hypothetical protein